MSIFLIILAIVLCGVGVGVNVWGIIDFYNSIKIWIWKSVEGNVIETDKEIEYSYKVNGIDYTSNRIHWVESSFDEETMNELKGKVKSSKTVKIYYNPKNHAEAVLSKYLTSEPIVKLIGKILIGFGIICLAITFYSMTMEDTPMFECF